MEESYFLTIDDIVKIFDDYNNQDIVNKVKKMSMNTETYNTLMTEKMVPLSMLANEIKVDDSIEDDKIKVSSEISVEVASNEKYEEAHVKKVHHQSKYTKKKYVYKKKNKRRRK